MPKQQVKIGKYTIENDATCAVNHYATVWSTHAYINKFIVRRLKLKYLKKLEQEILKETAVVLFFICKDLQ